MVVSRLTVNKATSVGAGDHPRSRIAPDPASVNPSTLPRRAGQLAAPPSRTFSVTPWTSAVPGTETPTSSVHETAAAPSWTRRSRQAPVDGLRRVQRVVDTLACTLRRTAGQDGIRTMGLRWHTLVVECSNVDRLASWWAEVLGWRRLTLGGAGAVIAPADVADRLESISPDDRGPGIIFIPASGPKKVKSRLHIDLAPRCESSQHGEIERLLQLGATAVDIGQDPDVPWRVLADPEGNEFCVLPDCTP